MKYFVNILIQKQIISYAERDIYLYGLECKYLKILHYASYILIALFLNSIVELLIFWMVFGVLRRNAGGYHANTRTGCYVFSCIAVLTFLVCSHINITYMITLMMMFFSDLFIWKFAPVNSGNMDLSNAELIHFQKKSRRILFLINFGYLICTIFKLKHIMNIVAESCILIAFMLFLGLLKNKFINK